LAKENSENAVLGAKITRQQHDNLDARLARAIIRPVKTGLDWTELTSGRTLRLPGEMVAPTPPTDFNYDDYAARLVHRMRQLPSCDGPPIFSKDKRRRGN
uniref:CoA transferase n=1 Tax=Echinostoma caproni TaxID=27848 RepID=A0A183AMU6_9TREM